MDGVGKACILLRAHSAAPVQHKGLLVSRSEPRSRHGSGSPPAAGPPGPPPLPGSGCAPCRGRAGRWGAEPPGSGCAAPRGPLCRGSATGGFVGPRGEAAAEGGRGAAERPPGLGRVAASVPPLGVAGEETSLPAEPRAPGFAWDVRGEGGGWMVVGRSLPLWRAPVPKRVPAARCGGVGREVALPPLNANADSRRGF